MIIIKPVIGIVGRLNSGDSNIICVEEIRIVVTKMGGVPILILPIDKVNMKSNGFYSEDEIRDLERVFDMCDGFILPGGDTWYQLDEVVVKYAIRCDKPLLGICLGMQVLSKVLSNDKRIGYDNTIKNNTFINHLEPVKDYVHEVILDKFSKLYSIIGEEKISVNSRHSYHTPFVNNAYVSARSVDGLIEGVERTNKTFIIGVQWHPESNLDKDKYSIKIFRAFFNNLKYSQNFHKKSS